MLKFLGNVRDSVYSPAFYAELPAKPGSFSFKYILKLALLFAVLATVVGSLVLIPKAKALLANIPDKIADWYPAELVVTIEDGHVSINQPEPYFIPIPEEFIDELGGETTVSSYENFMVIDTKTPFDAEQFRAYRAVAWVTRDSIVVENNRKIEVIPLTDTPNTVIDRAWAEGVGTQILSILNKVPFIIIPIGLFFLGFFIVVIKGFYLLFAALLVMLVGLITKRRYSYPVAYQIALHAMTLPLIVFSISSWIFGWNQPIFLFSALLVVVVLINTMKREATPVVVTDVSANP